MIFCRFDFVVFFLIVWGLAWAFRYNSLRKIWLLAASYFFCCYANVRFGLLLLVATAIGYAAGCALSASGKESARKKIFVLAVILLTGMLFIFKYYNFFIATLAGVLKAAGLSAATLPVLLPLGISFYIFQCISFVTDVYRRKTPVPNALDFALYMAFFPRLMQGPIVRAGYFLPQLRRRPDFSGAAMLYGSWCIVFGVFKKVFIADRIGYYADEVFSFPQQYSAGTLALAAVVYSVQILCDFSGYSDIAVGTAKLLGYQINQNFRNPYIAPNVSDFWRRWHISLSTWLRDYLYIPLGGNRKGEVRTCLNQMITMLLGGLWHGANWTFVVWGGWHGLLLCVHKVFRTRCKNLSAPPVVAAAGCVAGYTATMLAVIVGWIVFRAATLGDAVNMIRRIVSGASGFVWIEPFTIFAVVLIVLYDLIIRFRPGSRLLRPKLGTFYYWWLLFTMLGLSIIFQPQSVSPFIYFQF